MPKVQFLSYIIRIIMTSTIDEDSSFLRHQKFEQDSKEVVDKGESEEEIAKVCIT